jgi:hypothetical protein
MFVVQVVDGSRRWISGVFTSKAATDAYLALIPGEARAKQSVIDLPELSYPLYICEDEKGFRFLTEAEVATELKKYAGELRRDDEGWCYTNLYRVADDWQPKRPGTDYMGALPHHHVTNFTLQCVEQHGFESLWR